jgi:hypothetical protein
MNPSLASPAPALSRSDTIAGYRLPWASARSSSAAQAAVAFTAAQTGLTWRFRSSQSRPRSPRSSDPWHIGIARSHRRRSGADGARSAARQAVRPGLLGYRLGVLGLARGRHRGVGWRPLAVLRLSAKTAPWCRLPGRSGSGAGPVCGRVPDAQRLPADCGVGGLPDREDACG